MRLLALVLAGALLPGVARGQEAYRDSAGRFALTPPAGWAAVPDSALPAAATPGQRFQAGYHRDGSADYFSFPYVLLRVRPGVPPDPEALAAELSATATAADRDTSRTSFPARYDREADVVRWSGTGSHASPRPLRYYMASRVTGFGQIFVFVYGLEPESLATAAILDDFVRGLKVEPAYAYRRAAAGMSAATLELIGALSFLALVAVTLAAVRVLGGMGD